MLFTDKPVNHLDRDGWCAVFVLSCLMFGFGMVAGEALVPKDSRMDKCKAVASIKGKMYYNCAGTIVQIGGSRG
jgi:hypothetical protein